MNSANKSVFESLMSEEDITQDLFPEDDESNAQELPMETLLDVNS